MISDWAEREALLYTNFGQGRAGGKATKASQRQSVACTVSQPRSSLTTRTPWHLDIDHGHIDTALLFVTAWSPHGAS